MSKILNNVYRWLSHRLPPQLVYWCALRVWVITTNSGSRPELANYLSDSLNLRVKDALHRFQLYYNFKLHLGGIYHTDVGRDHRMRDIAHAEKADNK